jgi:hypothetical protein
MPVQVRHTLSREEFDELRRVLEEYDIVDVSEELRAFVERELPEFAGKLPPRIPHTIH